MVDRAERGSDLLALETFQVALDDPGSTVGNEGERGIGPKLCSVAAEVTEENQIHAAQNGADGRHARLHHVGFTCLQSVECIDAGGIRTCDGHIEPVFFEEAALQRNRQRKHIHGCHHTDPEFYRILRLCQCQ
jgi:hypothetical protein